ncbi:hypothetical protein D9619_011941 [Psilocybe cf. subviscida]|uniref:Protein-S-isoprenylcysteine O-methyltransferase n=1 Tax=Psilocybe cf. subviscida TaxID=2480587 RepID=A0A8H5B0B4_9AGAR|nr:hypothetical protein D9619_011941 [Psilocybe cf. subviscida]
MASLATACVIAAVTTSIHIAITSPTPSPPKKDRLKADYTPFLFVCLQVLKGSIWVHAIIELAIALSHALALNLSARERLLSILLMDQHPHSRTISIPPIRFVAGLAVVIGGCIRWLSYREMGRYFTYHVTVLKEHRLVTTGPYSFVRHPGYTGGNLVQVGLVFWHGARGSWLRESDVYKSPIAWLVLVLCSISVTLTLKLYAERPELEDALLKKEFGKQWDDWAKNVPYRFLPGIV